MGRFFFGSGGSSSFWTCSEQHGDLTVVLAHLAGQLFVAGQHLAQPHQGTYDPNVDLNSPVAAQDAREQRYAGDFALTMSHCADRPSRCQGGTGRDLRPLKSREAALDVSLG